LRETGTDAHTHAYSYSDPDSHADPDANGEHYLLDSDRRSGDADKRRKCYR
jgi:hypothetical protein